MFRTSFNLKAASARKEDSIDTVYLSNDSSDDKLSNGASFIAIVILGVLENIFEICPFKRTNLNSMGLGRLTRASSPKCSTSNKTLVCTSCSSCTEYTGYRL